MASHSRAPTTSLRPVARPGLDSSPRPVARPNSVALARQAEPAQEEGSSWLTDFCAPQPEREEPSSWWGRALDAAMGAVRGAVCSGVDAAQDAVEGAHDPGQAERSPPDPFTVERGQLTFDAEGTEGGPFHTRTAHKPPGQASGVTIGRGYDMGQRSPEGVRAHLIGAGVPETDANLLAAAAGLRGAEADAFLAANGGSLPEISPEAQQELFGTVYAEMQADVQRISNNYAATVAERDGVPRESLEVDLEALDPAVRDLAVDLRYRGDYTPATRRLVQPLIINNDLEGLQAAMQDRDFWSGVPEDRFNRRVQFLNEAAADRAAGQGNS